MTDRDAAPAAAEGTDNPRPRFWDWLTGNVNYTEWSKLDASAIAAMYCAWVAGQDSARAAPSAAPREGERRELLEALHVLYRAYRRRDALTFADCERIERLLDDG